MTTPSWITNARHWGSAASVALLLSGCVTTASDLGPHGTRELAAKDQRLFDRGQPNNLLWMHKNRVEEADRALAAGETQQAIRTLEGLTHQGLPQGYYELAKIYDQGLGVPRDAERAAALYRKAVATPSWIRGHASLNLARMSLEGDGVQRDDLLGYYLLQQAIEEDVGRDATLRLAALLSRGGDGVRADPARARVLYQELADNGDRRAMAALAQAHAPGGWLAEAPARVEDYRRRQLSALERAAKAGEPAAMVELAEVYAEGGWHPGNAERRRQWLSRAASAGEVSAMTALGRDHLEASDGKVRLAVAGSIAASPPGTSTPWWCWDAPWWKATA